MHQLSEVWNARPGASGHASEGGDHHGETWVEGMPGWAETLVVLGAQARSGIDTASPTESSAPAATTTTAPSPPSS